MFGLGTFMRAGEVFPGLVVGQDVMDLRADFGRGVTTRELVNSWDMRLPELRELAKRPRRDHALSGLRPMPPIDPPGQLLCAGANYSRHVREIMFTMARNDGDTRSDDELRAYAEEQVRSRRDSGTPFMFVAASSALSGAEDDVVLWGPGVQHDWELELAVVIGRPAHAVSPSEALDYVAGYTMSNDISARDVMNRPGFPLTDFLMSKSRPTFFPTGPFLVPREFVPNPRSMRLVLKVNGETMQDDLVDDMIYGVEELVSYASHAVVLAPGDIILTGSPAGNAGHHGNRWLRPGDLIESEISGLGYQRNVCVSESTEPLTVRTA